MRSNIDVCLECAVLNSGSRNCRLLKDDWSVWKQEILPEKRYTSMCSFLTWRGPVACPLLADADLVNSWCFLWDLRCKTILYSLLKALLSCSANAWAVFWVDPWNFFIFSGQNEYSRNWRRGGRDERCWEAPKDHYRGKTKVACGESLVCCHCCPSRPFLIKWLRSIRAYDNQLNIDVFIQVNVGS